MERKKLVFFGTGKMAEVIHYYAEAECGLEVVAFCVDAQYKTEDSFLGKPVFDFNDIEKKYPPSDFDFFVALGYHDLNALRARKCAEAIAKGYKLVSIISPHAHLPSTTKLGYNCFVMPPALIHPFVTLGNNVFVWSGAMIGHHSHVGDHVWLTSCSNISGNASIGEHTFIAVNATIGHSVKIGSRCFVGANTLLTKNLEDGQVVIHESSKPIKLNSAQFLRFSGFSSL